MVRVGGGGWCPNALRSASGEVVAGAELADGGVSASCIRGGNLRGGSSTGVAVALRAGRGGGGDTMVGMAGEGNCTVFI